MLIGLVRGLQTSEVAQRLSEHELPVVTQPAANIQRVELIDDAGRPDVTRDKVDALIAELKSKSAAKL